MSKCLLSNLKHYHRICLERLRKKLRSAVNTADLWVFWVWSTSSTHFITKSDNTDYHYHHHHHCIVLFEFKINKNSGVPSDLPSLGQCIIETILFKMNQIWFKLTTILNGQPIGKICNSSESFRRHLLWLLVLMKEQHRTWLCYKEYMWQIKAKSAAHQIYQKGPL
jgi:hypothetical protein